MSGKLDITVEQGATFQRNITIKDSANTIELSLSKFN